VTADRWHQIELEAKAQVTADVTREELVPLTTGSFVAWARKAHMGQTDGFSSVHRVGVTVGGTSLTTCGEIIPAPILRLVPLTPALIRALARCRHCEAINAQHGAAA
jgi:hypothetical protein